MVATTKVSSNVTDPVADLLTRLRNANIAYKDETLAPASKRSRAILRTGRSDQASCPARASIRRSECA